VNLRPKDCASPEEFDDKYGDDIFIENVEEYDRLAKVEPLLRGLKELETKLWINGRRRDHGFERSALQVLKSAHEVTRDFVPSAKSACEPRFPSDMRNECYPREIVGEGGEV
jgi:3'-phosphoadenosine 5'-phosphosulfate sulfotransferase (PAPS reductase)/FAD synthetase